MRNNEPTCPITIEPKPTIIAMPHNIKVISHAKLDPLHSPYATAKYASPIIKEIPARIMPNIGSKAKTVSPLKKEPTPAIARSTAIIVTPKGLYLCIHYMVTCFYLLNLNFEYSLFYKNIVKEKIYYGAFNVMVTTTTFPVTLNPFYKISKVIAIYWTKADIEIFTKLVLVT